MIHYVLDVGVHRYLNLVTMHLFLNIFLNSPNNKQCSILPLSKSGLNPTKTNILEVVLIQYNTKKTP